MPYFQLKIIILFKELQDFIIIITIFILNYRNHNILPFTHK